MKLRIYITLLATALAWPAATNAQDTKQRESEPPKSPEPAKDDTLTGPKVEAPPAPKTLVSHDFDGNLRRIDAPAEEAALALLDLTDEEKAAVEKVIKERAAILDKVVADNIPLLLKFQALRETGNKKDLALALREFFDKLADLRARGRLRDEIAAALTKEHAAEYNSLVQEYWRALIADATTQAKAQGEDLKPGAIVTREVLIAIGQEIKRSYDRQIAAKTDELDSFITRIGASPEQESKIRNMSIDFFQETLGKPTAQQRREFFLKIMDELTPPQRELLLKELYGAKAK